MKNQNIMLTYLTELEVRVQLAKQYGLDPKHSQALRIWTGQAKAFTPPSIQAQVKTLAFTKICARLRKLFK